jgi:hypothetical protein
MADKYIPDEVPAEYSAEFLQTELQRISDWIEEIETGSIIFPPVHVEPEKVEEGLVVNADGTDWNPGSGAGLYQYLSSAWVKL